MVEKINKERKKQIERLRKKNDRKEYHETCKKLNMI